jgi:UDP-N-acetylmuramate dehydrogenase
MLPHQGWLVNSRQPTPAIEGSPHLKLIPDAPMANFTTWRIGGPADLLVRAGKPEDIITAASWGRGQGMPVTVIGGGSNLLVGDRGIRGLVIVARTPGERAEGLISVKDRDDRALVNVAAQAPLTWVGRYCSERGYGGMDWGVGLPGTIGGATVNNAGAHGTEQKDHLVSVTLLNESGEIEVRPLEWLDARYRHTCLKQSPQPRPYIVLSVEMELPKGNVEELKRLADEHAAYRHASQPTGRCAGSTFTNPPADFAGRLLEEAGLKDLAVGGVRFSPKHSNFIVNDGTATAAHVRELIAIAQERVQRQFGVWLSPEIEEIGQP